MDIKGKRLRICLCRRHPWDVGGKAVLLLFHFFFFFGSTSTYQGKKMNVPETLRLIIIGASVATVIGIGAILVASSGFPLKGP